MSYPAARPLLIVLFLAALLLALTTGLHAITQNNPLGADFYTFWVAGRAALQGQNPYSAEVTLQSQIGILGRPARPGEDQLAFAYPPYSLLVLLPVLWLPFDWAQAAWLATLLIAVLVIWRISFRNAPTWLIISFLFFYPVSFGLLLGNFSIPISLILLTFYRFCVEKTPSHNTQIAFGLLLGWITIKPQFVWAFLLLILLFAMQRKYTPLLLSLPISVLLWAGLGWLLAPGWPMQWATRIIEYAAYVQSQPVITLAFPFLPSVLRSTLLIGSALAAILLSIRLMHSFSQQRGSLLLLFSWAGLITFLFHPHGMAYEQNAFLLPFALWGVSTLRSHPQQRIWWWAMLACTWLAFILGLSYPPADVWPIFLYLGWWIWLFRRR